MRILIGIAIFSGVIVLLIALFAVYHRLKLRIEQKKIVPNGRLIEVNGYQMHVYVEGNNKEAPTLVFLSGSTITSPVYDFKPVWSRLSKEYRIAVVERLGYGYSDVADTSRDIDTLLKETRAALSLADVVGPYVLCPHSLSGLESLRFAQISPEEVAGIVGIDMLVPDYFLENGESLVKQFAQLKSVRPIFWMGMHRLPIPSETFKLSTLALTEKEQEQSELLAVRNLFNDAIFNEVDHLFDNARIVVESGAVNVPIKLLVANRQATPEMSKNWIQAGEKFAEEYHLPIKSFDSGHSLHQEKPEAVADEISEFVKGLKNNKNI